MEIYLANLKHGIREEEIASIFSYLNPNISVRIIQSEDKNPYAIVVVPRKRKSLFKTFTKAFKA